MTSSNGNIFHVTGPFVREIYRSPVDSTHKGQWRGALVFSLMCPWTNDWANSPDAGDLRWHYAYCDVTVMMFPAMAEEISPYLQKTRKWRCVSATGEGIRTTRTQDNSYPRQLVPKTTRTQENSYPRQIAPKTTADCLATQWIRASTSIV